MGIRAAREKLHNALESGGVSRREAAGIVKDLKKGGLNRTEAKFLERALKRHGDEFDSGAKRVLNRALDQFQEARVVAKGSGNGIAATGAEPTARDP